MLFPLNAQFSRTLNDQRMWTARSSGGSYRWLHILLLNTPPSGILSNSPFAGEMGPQHLTTTHRHERTFLTTKIVCWSGESSVDLWTTCTLFGRIQEAWSVRILFLILCGEWWLSVQSFCCGISFLLSSVAVNWSTQNYLFSFWGLYWGLVSTAPRFYFCLIRVRW